VLVESQISSGNPLYRQLAASARVKTFPELKGEVLLNWIKKRASEEGGDITSPAASLLARLVGSNLWVLASELEKLGLYAGKRQITEEDINTLVGYVQQASVFAMADAILEFKPARAEELLQKLLAEGASPGYLLAMLLRQVRLVIRARELKRLGNSPSRIQQALGVQDFVARKALQQASAYSMDRLKEIYIKLLETDLDIKTGRREAELALNILALELSQHRQPVARGGTG
jgi:DNA polymerase-3 subunit delta